MPRKRHKSEQIIHKLREAEVCMRLITLAHMQRSIQKPWESAYLTSSSKTPFAWSPSRMVKSSSPC